MTSHASVAASVRDKKRLHPEQFCAYPGCLWRILDGEGRWLGVPCGKHAVLGAAPAPDKGGETQ